MDEKTLLRVSIVCCFIGISILFFIFSNQDVKEPEALESNMDEHVEIKGEVERVSQKKDLTFLHVKRETTVPIVFFEKINTLRRNDQVKVIGKVSEYEGETELIGKKYSLR